MAKFIPLISSRSAGPLGAIHLPRLWQKLSLGASNQLHDDWDLCGGGFDQMTLDGLGLNKDKTIAFVKASKPTYAEFEAWVKANGTKLSAADIKKHNDAVNGYNHGDDTRKAILGAAGFKDEGKVLDAVRLNEIEDWNEFHAAHIK
ncbi:MAG: DUF5069 domain-containing protein [Candidatus Poribacteria bacterium]|nr:DUF5069 domain-containing protein [Candidatus Poribacteria bacterium]